MKTPLDIARQVISEEAAALERMASSFGRDLDAILNTIIHSTDQVVISGLGKSGDIARKIAASLTSTGTPAVFMHPVEALHGDLGIVTESHCLIALSRSGNTDELVRFVTHFLRRGGGSVIGITQGAASRLVELSRHSI
ncbi:MAG: SIS domain-containing protein, partial [Planctomycetes bacterium]|nr:SIS domain-containing protein [Planctomycetota bacterium]